MTKVSDHITCLSYDDTVSMLYIADDNRRVVNESHRRHPRAPRERRPPPKSKTVSQSGSILRKVPDPRFPNADDHLIHSSLSSGKVFTKIYAVLSRKIVDRHQIHTPPTNYGMCHRADCRRRTINPAVTVTVTNKQGRSGIRNYLLIFGASNIITHKKLL